MLPPFRQIPLSQFRKTMPAALSFVREQNGHLWLMHHSRLVAGVVPVDHMRMIERFESQSLEQVERRNRELYDRWQRVKGDSKTINL